MNNLNKVIIKLLYQNYHLILIQLINQVLEHNNYKIMPYKLFL